MNAPFRSPQPARQWPRRRRSALALDPFDGLVHAVDESVIRILEAGRAAGLSDDEAWAVASGFFEGGQKALVAVSDAWIRGGAHAE